MSSSSHLILAMLFLSVSTPAATDPARAVLSFDSHSNFMTRDSGEQFSTLGTPVRLEAVSGDSLACNVDPADVNHPEENGDRIRWTLVERAIGSVTSATNVANVAFG